MFVPQKKSVPFYSTEPCITSAYLIAKWYQRYFIFFVTFRVLAQKLPTCCITVRTAMVMVMLLVLQFRISHAPPSHEEHHPHAPVFDSCTYYVPALAKQWDSAIHNLKENFRLKRKSTNTFTHYKL